MPLTLTYVVGKCRCRCHLWYVICGMWYVICHMSYRRGLGVVQVYRCCMPLTLTYICHKVGLIGNIAYNKWVSLPHVSRSPPPGQRQILTYIDIDI
jgi:hypothetical protein